MHKLNPREKADAFLALAGEFQLGHLPTEERHTKTKNLSQLAQESLPNAIELLRIIELEALNSAFENKSAALLEMAREIRNTLQTGGRIFLCGCGATGRLSLSLESLWRFRINELPHTNLAELKDKVISFMAGGDYALVRSIENFEDHPEYGAKQLQDLGFAKNDLLISTTEGGETPFVIGATEAASGISQRKPYFLFCNPEGILRKTADRSRRVLENHHIISISLVTGPMALAGSTRLQATTVLMLAVGAALFSTLENKEISFFINDFKTALETNNFLSLQSLIECESEIYTSGNICAHSSERHAMTVITDTTERSPTFSLVPFEDSRDPLAPLSWTYLYIPNAENTQHAWNLLLGRTPRAIIWPTPFEKYGPEALNQFDFDRSFIRRFERRKECSADCNPEHLRRRQLATHQDSVIWSSALVDDQIVFSMSAQSSGCEAGNQSSESNPKSLEPKSLESKIEAHFKKPISLLAEHLLVKCALNICSTLVMGRLGRFQSNIMLFVRSSNNKLIDRSIRFTLALLHEAGIHEFNYDDVCYTLFVILEDLPQGEAAVPKAYELLSQQHKVSPKSIFK
jgi:N-acetylmuramic acid 6-phosphate etherase